MPKLMESADSETGTDNSSLADRLRGITVAVRIAFTWLGTRKTLTSAQQAEAADTFGAEGNFVSAAKKLLDTKHSSYQKVTAIRSRIIHDWRSRSLPFPESGIRLIRQEEVSRFQSRMEEAREELHQAVRELDTVYGELRRSARERLGRLYDPSDYPPSLADQFEVTWDFPNVEPPLYLRQLSPALYEQECQRVTARFDEAVQLAENAFVGELNRLVAHLTERLSGQEDGKPKVFRDSAIDNLTEFFERFRRLNIRSNEQLDDLVNRSHGILSGVEPHRLRSDQPFRQQVATQLSGVQSALEGLLVDRPRRQILRRPR